MKKIYYLLVISVLFLVSCKTQLLDQNKTYIPEEENSVLDNSKAVATNANVFYFIRHCEPNGNSKTNPHLSKAGIKRAHLYKTFFANKSIDTVFSTNLNRTFDTSSIIAKTKGQRVYFYDPFDIDYVKFLENHKSNSLVIIGHSNTTPEFVNGVLGKYKYSQMVDDNYSNIYKVSILNGKIISNQILVLEKEIQKIEDAKLSPSELRKVLRQRKKNKK